MASTENFAFVLVRPRSAGNIGSVARALKNMGFVDLRIVSPSVPPKSRMASSMAVHGGDVLQSAQVFDSLNDAIADRTLTVGTTCRAGLYRSAMRMRSLREAVPELVTLARENQVAILFGPEDTGLTNREIKLCQRLITIRTAPEYSSLNLAQAVLLVAYELMMSMGTRAPLAGEAMQFASAAEVDAMLERMKEALLGIGFLPEDNPDHIMFAL